MVKAIIFDCFGVLTTEGWLNFKEKHFGNSPELLEQATDLNKRANLGLLSDNEFINQVSGLANVSEDETRKSLRSNVPNEPLFDYIKNQLKPSYKIAVLSNASANWLPDLFSSEQIKLIDQAVLSYEAGVVKPDPRSFEVAAEKLGVKPEECVFIDDQERYARAATGVGMKAVWYRDFGQMKADLEKILADSKS